MFLHCISDEIKTTRDQVTTQSNIPVIRLLLLNMKCHYYISFIIAFCY